MNFTEIKNELNSCDNVRYREFYSASSFTSFKTGGECPLCVFPQTEEAMVNTLFILKRHRARFNVLGNASNIIIPDEGFCGVLVFTECLKKVADTENGFIAQAGVSLTGLAKKAMNRSLTGLEFAYGIPGSVGGAVFMNAGAYGSEMKNVVESVRFVNQNGEVEELSGEALGMGYRRSVFAENGGIVLSAKFALKEGKKASISAEMKKFMEARKTKQPLEYPSAGSAFKRPEGHYAGKLIEEAGLKGFSVGGAQVSEKHAGFVINRGGATTKDIIDLLNYVKDKVYENSGVTLEPEIRVIK